MTYLEHNSCFTKVMIRFREIASVRLPGNKFRRRHMSPKGIRPGIIGAGGEPSTWLPPEGLVERKILDQRFERLAEQKKDRRLEQYRGVSLLGSYTVFEICYLAIERKRFLEV